MYEITPTYYAGSQTTGDFILHGKGFLHIPDSAVGVVAISNGRPLQFRRTIQDFMLYRISNLTDTDLTLSPIVSTTFEGPVYIGGILSSDRETLYWLNDTEPLP